VLQAAAMAAKWWEPPRDALDAMVLGAADLGSLAGLRHTAFTPFDPTLKVARRTRACVWRCAVCAETRRTAFTAFTTHFQCRPQHA
jgi:hypothetical protein